MKYDQLRKEILQYVGALQQKCLLSYQAMCDYINSRQTEFVLYKDFFSRFQSNTRYFSTAAKHKKLSLIHLHLRELYQQHLPTSDTEEMLEKVIRQASTVKFETYLAFSRSKKKHHSRLSECYVEKGPAYLSIKNNIRHKEQYNWELDVLDHGSTFKILSLQVENLFEENAVVTTKEYWKLCWVNKHSRQLQFRLESVGPQVYLLSTNERDQWKVIENITKTPAQKIEPEYIDYALLERLSSRSWEENRILADEFLSNHQLLHCIEFMKICFAGRLSRSQSDVLHRMRESYFSSHRLLNTDVIDFNAYKSEIDSLHRQIQLIKEGIFLINKK